MSVVAIVGRQNVGKSTLFNRLVGRRKALVSDEPGVTRDRHYAEAEWVGRQFLLVDTGGLSFDEGETVEARVHRQSMAAVAEADTIICLFDGQDGVTNTDREVVGIFRRSGKEVIYAVNKIDSEKAKDSAVEFSELGVDLVYISAEHGREIDQLLDRLIEVLPPAAMKEGRGDGLKIAIVGRPNVGKSTIINQLSMEERVVVHETPGTTRDTIDVEIDFQGRGYVFVDTAGIKKRAKTREKLDKFSTLKSLRAIDDADIVFVVLDAEEGVSHQDLTLAAHSFNLCRATAILVNKWDLMAGRAKEKAYLDLIRQNLKELHGLPILCISGKTGYNCRKIFNIADMLDEVGRRRIPTSDLNRFVETLTKTHPPPDYRGRHVRLNYITQAETDPPVFVVFTNQPGGTGGIKDSYKRYLTKGLRRLIGEPMIPIVVKYKSKR